MKQFVRYNDHILAIIESDQSVSEAWYEFKKTYDYPFGILDIKGLEHSFKRMKEDGLVGDFIEEMFLDWFEKKYGPVEYVYTVDLI